MNARQKIHQTQLHEWAIRFSEQKECGLSNKEYCSINQLSIHSYNYWKRILKEQIADQMLPDIVPIALPSVPASPMHPIQQSNSNHNATTHLTINGLSMDIDSNVSEDFLRTLIKAVRYV